MKAAIYLRVSTGRQATADHVSLSVQEQACRAFIQAEGGDVVVVLRDSYSGLDPDRPEYLRLKGLAAKREVDTVVIYRIDRFGRDPAEYFPALRTLHDLGVEVLSATEPNQNDFLRGILILLGAEESKRIRARTLPAIFARLKEGKWVTHAPLGYTIVPAPDGGKTLQPNETAWKVTRLFDLYAQGKHSLRDLAREAAILELTLDRSQLSRLLRNPGYIGHSVWGRREKLAPRKSRGRERRDWYEFPGLHPAIVDAATFDQVQAMLTLNRERQGPPTPERQLLIGRLRCGSCGSPMYASQRRTARYPDKLYYSYKCPRKHESHGQGCPQQTLVTWVADDQVKHQIAAGFRLNGPEERRRAEAIIATGRDGHLEGMAQRKRQLQRALSRQESEQRSLTRKLARGIVGDHAYQQAYAEMELLAGAVRRELSDLDDVVIPDVSAALAKAASIDWQDLDKEAWREIVLGFCERINLNGRTVAIAWNDEALALRRVLAAAAVGVK